MGKNVIHKQRGVRVTKMFLANDQLEMETWSPNYEKNDDLQAELKFFQSKEDLEVSVNRIEVDEAPKVLGCHMVCTCLWDEELSRWAPTASNLANSVKKAMFNRKCGSKIYEVLWISKFRYVAAVVCFDTKEYKDIEQKVVSSCLSTTRFN